MQKKTEIEIYFKEHYGTHVKPLVDAEDNKCAEIDGEPLAKGLKLKMLKEITKEADENEDITLQALI